MPGAETVAAALIGGVTNNKVVWLCLGVAVWHLLRGSSPALGAAHLVAAIPALLFSAFAGGIWPWIGLSATLLLLLLPSSGNSGAARTGMLIALIAALHEILIYVLGALSGDTLLGVDAWVARSLAAWILPTLAAEGNALQALDGHMLVLVWGCSSFSNLGDALLLFWALVSIYAVGHGQVPIRGRFILCMVLLACLTVALNAIRLALMAGNLEAYAYLHAGNGAVWFRLAALGCAGLVSLLALSR